MQIPKPAESDKVLFLSVLSGLPGAEIKPMFGNLGAFVNGNMFAGLFGSTLGVRLSELDRAELEETTPTVPFGPAERPMAGYAGLSMQEEPERLERWVERAFAAAAKLPQKAPKAAKAPKAPD